MGYEVHVLHTGYSGTTDQGMIANCSCTLIRGRHNVIVDTMTPWDKDRIISGMCSAFNIYFFLYIYYQCVACIILICVYFSSNVFSISSS